jgi:hypothetical protein
MLAHLGFYGKGYVLRGELSAIFLQVESFLRLAMGCGLSTIDHLAAILMQNLPRDVRGIVTTLLTVSSCSLFAFPFFQLRHLSSFFPLWRRACRPFPRGVE